MGLSLGLSDDNILGSGNKIDSSLGFTSDTILFDVGLTQKPLLNPNITFRYNAFNNENDYKDSFGYKSKSTGIGFGIKSYINKNISNNITFKLSSNENYDSKNSALSISDNIGKFNKFSINYSISNDKLNNEIYPTQGSFNSFGILLTAITSLEFLRLLILSKSFLEHSIAPGKEETSFELAKISLTS